MKSLTPEAQCTEGPFPKQHPSCAVNVANNISRSG